MTYHVGLILYLFVLVKQNGSRISLTSVPWNCYRITTCSS